MDHLSNSQINLYLLCSQKYKFQYIEKLPKPFKASALAFGSALHSALSWLHKDRMNGSHATLDRLYRIFDADWYSQRVDADVRFKEGEDDMKLALMGKEMLSLYFKEPPKKLKGTEVPFIVPLVNPSNGEILDVKLEGFFDLVEADDTIVEFKTSAQVLSLSDIDASMQLTAYGYAFEHLHGRMPKGFKLVNFVKNKKIRMEVTETTRGKSDLVGFFTVAEQVLKGIRSGVYIPHTGYWCKDCEYRAQCPIWKDKM
jgi:putative RecB family exonuclease